MIPIEMVASEGVEPIMDGETGPVSEGVIDISGVVGVAELDPVFPGRRVGWSRVLSVSLTLDCMRASASLRMSVLVDPGERPSWWKNEIHDGVNMSLEWRGGVRLSAGPAGAGNGLTIRAPGPDGNGIEAVLMRESRVMRVRADECSLGNFGSMWFWGGHAY